MARTADFRHNPRHQTAPRTMDALLGFSRLIDLINERIGRLDSGLVLLD